MAILEKSLSNNRLLELHAQVGHIVSFIIPKLEFSNNKLVMLVDKKHADLNFHEVLAAGELRISCDKVCTIVGLSAQTSSYLNIGKNEGQLFHSLYYAINAMWNAGFLNEAWKIFGADSLSRDEALVTVRGVDILTTNLKFMIPEYKK